MFLNSYLFSYTSTGSIADVENSRSNYYNGSCSYTPISTVKSVYELYYPVGEHSTSLSSCSTSSTYSNYAKIISLNADPNFVKGTSFLVSEDVFSYCKTNGLESSTGSYYAKGIHKVKQVCNYTFVGTCTLPQVYDDSVGACVTPPVLDTDGDGIPDKCDIDSIDIATLDCDGDGLANNSDGDIDGDGVPNSSDADALSASNTTSCPSIPSGYNLNLSVVDSSSCILTNPIFTANDGDLFYFKYANWDNCRNHCYTFQTSCPKGQAIKNGECRSVEPDISDCAGTSSCRIIGLGVGDLQSCFKTCNCLTTSAPTPTTENNYFYEEVSCADNQTDKDKLDDLRDSSEVNTSVNKLDINGTVNNDSAASFKAALDSYAGAKESTALSQLKELSIQSLEAVKTNSILDNLKSLAENFFNTSTSNDGVIDGTLHGIKDNTAISNNLLTGIKDGVDGLKENSDKVLNNVEGKNSDGTLVDISDVQTNIANVDSFLTDIQSSFTNISSSYSSLTANIEQGFSYSTPAGTSVATTVNAFGRSITFDISPALIQLSPIIYYFTYVSMFLVAIKIIFLGFMVV